MDNRILSKDLTETRNRLGMSYSLFAQVLEIKPELLMQMEKKESGVVYALPSLAKKFKIIQRLKKEDFDHLRKPSEESTSV